MSTILLNNYIELLVRYFIPFDIVKDLIELGTGTSGSFPIITAIFSGLLGPLPTLLPLRGYENMSVFSSGLIIKVFLSSYFVLGSFLIFIKRNKLLLPIVIFSLLEILSLSYLLETFELRKSLPHFPFVIMIALYTFESIQQKRYNRLILNTMRLSNLILVLVVFFWNYLRFI